MPAFPGAAMLGKAVGGGRGLAGQVSSETVGLNLRQAGLLTTALFFLTAVPFTALWGLTGLAVAVILLALIVFLAVFLPPDFVMRLYQARPIARDQSQLSSLVDVLAHRADLPQRPDLYVIPSATLASFSTGSQARPAIAVTEGLLRRLSLSETASVLAHETAHIRHGDLGVLGLADVATRGMQLLSYIALGLLVFNVVAFATGEDTVSWWVVVLLYLAPAVFSLLQLRFSRAREFEADRFAVTLMGDAAPLVAALRHLDPPTTGEAWEDLMYPVPGRRVPFPSLLRSHPETDERVQALQGVEPAPDGHLRHAPLNIVEQPMVSLVGYGPGDMRPRHRWSGLWF